MITLLFSWICIYFKVDRVRDRNRDRDRRNGDTDTDTDRNGDVAHSSNPYSQYFINIVVKADILRRSTLKKY